MYVVTGGAGFIGSNLVAALAARGAEIVVCDWLGTDERWRNLAAHELADIILPEHLPAYLQRHAQDIKALIHMGAVSTTTETDVGLIVARNLRCTLDILHWCCLNQTPLIYASSAATYGDGSAGFDDDMGCEQLARLRPLNPYGWSKHVVDRRVARLAASNRTLPPQWAALKFFNVYGPNEYHKNSMQSVIAKNYQHVAAGGSMSLFRSCHPDYPDGGQMRDFIYVQDCVEVIMWLLDHPQVSGLFNVGSGMARTWLDLANALFDAADQPRRIEFIEMPASLQPKYQYYTQANVSRLRAAGFRKPFTSLEEGISTYVRRFLATDQPYR